MRRLCIGIIYVLFTGGCWQKPTTLYEARRYVTNYIDSGAYTKEFTEIASDAREYLKDRASEGEKNLAIVLDIDETALSSWQAYRLNEFARIVEGGCDLEKGPCGIQAWQAMAKAPPLKPVAQLVRDAKKFGIKVFFISARPPELQEATERNLKEAGFTFDRVILLPSATKKLISAIEFKAPQRKALFEEGYKIVLCIGDQDSDLEGGYCERGFKLPNPVYYLP